MERFYPRIIYVHTWVPNYILKDNFTDLLDRHILLAYYVNIRMNLRQRTPNIARRSQKKKNGPNWLYVLRIIVLSFIYVSHR